MELVGRDRIIGMIWPYIGLPADLGVSITQDYMPLLNPELYRDFELPCLKRISDHFGGVFIHCCGRYAHHLENLKNSGVLIRGLETHHPQTLLNEIYRVFGNEIAYVPYVAPDGKKEFPEMSAYVDYLATTSAAKARYWFPLTCAPSAALKPHALRESIKSKLGGAKIES